MRIILASSSPRRKELLKELGIDFEIITKDVDETFTEENIIDASMNVSKRKAVAVFNDIDGDVIVISGDTIVTMNNKIYGKPKDYNEAYSMIETFSGNNHEVISSLCVLIRKDNKVYEELTYDKATVYCEKLEKYEIEDWINNHDVYTRAGAYAIQDGFGKHVKKIDGDYFSIVGLPIHKLYSILKKYLGGFNG